MRKPILHLARGAGVALLLATLSGCAVVDVAGAAVGAAIRVTGAVVSTGVELTGKAIGAGVDAARGSSEEDEAAQKK
jgi:hypothetical protein